MTTNQEESTPVAVFSATPSVSETVVQTYLDNEKVVCQMSKVKDFVYAYGLFPQAREVINHFNQKTVGELSAPLMDFVNSLREQELVREKRDYVKVYIQELSEAQRASYNTALTEARASSEFNVHVFNETYFGSELYTAFTPHPALSGNELADYKWLMSRFKPRFASQAVSYLTCLMDYVLLMITSNVIAYAESLSKTKISVEMVDVVLRQLFPERSIPESVDRTGFATFSKTLFKIQTPADVKLTFGKEVGSKVSEYVTAYLWSLSQCLTNQVSHSSRSTLSSADVAFVVRNSFVWLGWDYSGFDAFLTPTLEMKQRVSAEASKKRAEKKEATPEAEAAPVVASTKAIKKPTVSNPSAKKSAPPATAKASAKKPSATTPKKATTPRTRTTKTTA